MKKEILEEINRLKEQDDKESHKKIIELVEQEISSSKEEKLKKQYDLIKKQSEIRLIEIELEATPEDDKKNQIHLIGRLIKLYKKQMSLAIDSKGKMDARYKVIELLEKQRELTKDYKRTNTDLKLKDKVALTIKDITQAIEIFLNKKEVIDKIKEMGLKFRDED